MNKQHFILILLLAMMGCKSEQEFALTIPEDKLKLIFKDMVIAGEAVELYAEENQDSVRELFLVQISKIHNIPVAEIESNMEMLKSNEKKFLLFCDSVAIEFRDQDKNFSYGRGNKKDNVKVDQKDAAIKKAKEAKQKENKQKN